MSCCSPGTGCFEWIKLLVQAVPGVIIAALAGLIAYRQAHIAENKLRFDLFQRRLTIFEQTWQLVSKTFIKGAGEQREGFFTSISNIIPEARFLFGSEIGDYLDECISKLGELDMLEKRATTMFVEKDPQVVINRTNELQAWFLEEGRKGCRDKFAPYLDFSKWK